MKKTILLILMCLTMVLSSCATQYNAATGKRELMMINNSSEEKLGENFEKEIETKYVLSKDPVYIKKVNDIGNRLISNIDKRGIGYKFKVVENEKINAFTIPGGNVYATTGLLDAAGSDDELAAVLAHEIGHVEARHAVKHLETAMGYTTLMQIGYLLDPRKEEEKGEWKYVRSGTDAVFKLIDLGYSRKDEYEADRLSVKFMKKAGYDPNAILSLMQKLKDTQAGSDPEWLYFIRSHPYIDDRMEAVRAELDSE